VGDSDRVFVVAEIHELRVNKRIIDIFVTKHFYDVKGVFGFVVFHCGFPMPKSVEAYAQYPWILNFRSDFSPLFVEESRLASERLLENST
jgi:hypothetical protein